MPRFRRDDVSGCIPIAELGSGSRLEFRYEIPLGLGLIHLPEGVRFAIPGYDHSMLLATGDLSYLAEGQG